MEVFLPNFYYLKEYKIHGIMRRGSTFTIERIDHLYQDPHKRDRRLILHYGDMSDAANLIRIVQKIQLDEIYNLATQSHLKASFEKPECPANTDALGVLKLLELIRILGLENKTKFY
jgi:GDPmannose 4,6-dehydratase